jgi:hypothetical protein
MERRGSSDGHVGGTSSGLLLAAALAVRLVGVQRRAAIGPRELAIVPDVSAGGGVALIGRFR